MLMFRKKGGIGVGFAIVLIFLIYGIFIFAAASQHVYHGEHQLRALGEAQLLSESSKLETWVRNFQKAAELSLIESSIDSGSGIILLPYEFDWYYSPSNLPYWQIYDTSIPFCINGLNLISLASPSEFENNNGWYYPENAFFSDNSRAYTLPPSLSSTSITYKNFKFNLPSDAEIKKVEMGVEWYTSSSYETFYGSASWDGGNSWFEIQLPTQYSENVYILDLTGATSWDIDKLSENNFRVKLRAYNSYTEGGGGGGCYPNSTYLLTFNSTHYIFKSPEEIEIGELVICYKEGLRTCKVVGIDKHMGEWNLIKIFTGTKSLTLTDNHPVLLPKLNKTVEAKELKEGDEIYYLKDGKVWLYEIKKIENLEDEGFVYDIKIDENAVLFSKDFDYDILFDDFSRIEAIDMLIPKSFSTTYLDLVYVKVTYDIGKKFICPEEILKNYFKQKISLISLNYLENYRESFKSLSENKYEIDFSGSIEPRIYFENGVLKFKNKNILGFKRNFTDAEGNKVEILRKSFLTTNLYTNFDKIVKKAVEIIENDYVGRCLNSDTSLQICSHNKLNENEARNVLKILEKKFEENDIEVSFDIENFENTSSSFFAIVNISLLDNTSSFAAYDFLNDSMKLDFIGLKFAVKVGDLISNSYQERARNLDLFRNCNSFGILTKKNQNEICNFFSKSSIFSEDSDNGNPFIFGTCSDFTGDYPDYCLGNLLYEYKSSGNICYFEKISCDCLNGACR